MAPKDVFGISCFWFQRAAHDHRKTNTSLLVLRSFDTVGVVCGSWPFLALGKWGRTQMGSDGFNRILTGFYLLDSVEVRPVPFETHDFKGSRPDFIRILTGL